MMPRMPTPLWEPPEDLADRALMTRFIREQGHADYHALWRWSAEDLEGFWAAIWDFFEVGERSGPVLASAERRGAKGFPGVRRNYARQVFAGKDDAAEAIVAGGELRDDETIT